MNAVLSGMRGNVGCSFLICRLPHAPKATFRLLLSSGVHLSHVTHNHAQRPVACRPQMYVCMHAYVCHTCEPHKAQRALLHGVWVAHAAPCVSQGKLEAAVEAYRQAIDMWAVQRVVVWFSLSNALVELGRWVRGSGADTDTCVTSIYCTSTRCWWWECGV